MKKIHFLCLGIVCLLFVSDALARGFGLRSRPPIYIGIQNPVPDLSKLHTKPTMDDYRSCQEDYWELIDRKNELKESFYEYEGAEEYQEEIQTLSDENHILSEQLQACLEARGEPEEIIDEVTITEESTAVTDSETEETTDETWRYVNVGDEVCENPATRQIMHGCLNSCRKNVASLTLTIKRWEAYETPQDYWEQEVNWFEEHNEWLEITLSECLGIPATITIPTINVGGACVVNCD